jgi:hypothetical protein
VCCAECVQHSRRTSAQFAGSGCARTSRSLARAVRYKAHVCVAKQDGCLLLNTLPRLLRLRSLSVSVPRRGDIQGGCLRHQRACGAAQVLVTHMVTQQVYASIGSVYGRLLYAHYNRGRGKEGTAKASLVANRGHAHTLDGHAPRPVMLMVCNSFHPPNTQINYRGWIICKGVCVQLLSTTPPSTPLTKISR